ncbi:hypothetical protein E6W39_19620 [Kitasatospora acidiphila]|uniref:Transmembrane protein n=1 Tax=Kitasatospora acidiphila TaxID=2567942 RepID=A0A540W6R1_9ACTN|nr:hypothetical protein [Kitasatospora acidiphila]TQF04034.1 hypothetical protein E6W39_19620 [Kitasatospora acidiphila]
MNPDRPRWWLSATICTAITMPLIAFAGFFAILSPFAYDDCDPGGCPQSDQHITAGLICLAVSLVLLVAAWPAARFHREGVRSTLYLLAPTAALASLAMLASTPAGH